MKNTFTVKATFKVDLALWSSMGYGNKPTAPQLRGVFYSYSHQVAAPGTFPSVTVVPNAEKFTATVKVSVETPWWKLGFGTRTSRQETTDDFNDFVNNFSKIFAVSVTASS